jgi:5-methylcytosine-specific restriction endonuclease McrA
MTIEEEFLHKSMVLQHKYANIQKEMNLNAQDLTAMWDKLEVQRKEMAKILSLFKRKIKTDDPNVKFNPDEFKKFTEWYISAGKQCHYCGLTKEDINKLVDTKLIYTKRITTRGKSLEVERILPNEPYSNTENLVWCCYWCNNAKTDEFSEDEFKTIGIAIKSIWKNRLMNKS